MEDAMPQDEYFEWEDIMLYRAPCEVTESGKGCQQTLEYRRTFTHTFEETDSDSEDFQWSESASETVRTTSTATAIQTSFTFKSWNSETKDSPIDFPSYDDLDLGLGGLEKATPIVEDVSFPEAPATIRKIEEEEDDATEPFEEPAITETRDCSSICLQPCGNVNYLLHHWREEDVSASWKHLVTKSKTWGSVAQLDHSSWKRHNTVARLENASWRTWSKLRFGLKTVDPEIINWMKHCDDTCLYGPFTPGTRSWSSVSESSRDVRTPNSKSDPRMTTSILKKPSMAEILRRGSLPTFSANQSQSAVQGCPLSDASPLTYLQTSHQHIEFCTTIPTRDPDCPKKKVKFLEEVRQYTIVNPIGDRKIHRTIKKTRSTTLQAAAYFLDTTPMLTPDPEPALSHWSPDSLWSYNPESQPKTAELKEWTWLGVASEDDSHPHDYFSSRPIHGSSSSNLSTPDPQTPDLSSTASTSIPIPISKGSLTHYNIGIHLSSPSALTPEEVDDEFDYLLASSPLTRNDRAGSFSPESQSSRSSSEETESSSSESGDEVPVTRYGAGDVADEKVGWMREMRVPVRGMGIGIVDDEKHALYEQIMEEFELGY